MNFLGHLFLSNNKPELMMANLYGDFVKGKDYSHLPVIVQEGVLLHREIDDYIDHHPDITALRLKLYKELPKVAGIAIDLYMDHCLAKSWRKYHALDLSDFLNTFFHYALKKKNQEFKNSHFKYPENFIKLLNTIHSQQWIENYKNIEGLSFAASGLSKRISFVNNLHEAPAFYLKHEKDIDAVFSIYMNDAIKKFNGEPTNHKTL